VHNLLEPGGLETRLLDNGRDGTVTICQQGVEQVQSNDLRITPAGGIGLSGGKGILSRTGESIESHNTSG
jgi:hypothetical protein